MLRYEIEKNIIKNEYKSDKWNGNQVQKKLK